MSDKSDAPHLCRDCAIYFVTQSYGCMLRQLKRLCRDGNVIGSVDEAYIVVALVASAVRRCVVDLG